MTSIIQLYIFTSFLKRNCTKTDSCRPHLSSTRCLRVDDLAHYINLHSLIT